MLEKIEGRKAEIAVIGLGYIGLPTAIMFANAGFHVTGYEIRRDVVEKINSGKAHIVEPEIDDLLKKAIENGTLRATSDPGEIKNKDVYIICVQTPLKEDKTPNLEYLQNAIETVAKVMKKGSLIIIESTVPPLTTAKMAELVERITGLTPGEDFYMVHAPERVMPGRIFKELVYNSRIFGGITPESAELAERLYRSFVKGQTFKTSSTVSEVVKLMENTFRDVNIALANEFALLAHQYGIDVFEAIELANTHPRVKIHVPGIGVGGHCLPKDPHLLVWPAERDFGLIRLAREINDSMPLLTRELLFNALHEANVPPNRAVVAVLGLAYKGNSDDTRNSPALAFIGAIRDDVAEVRTYDPFVGGTHKNLEAALKGADAVVIATDHTAFRSLDWEKLGMLMRTRVLVDGRHVIDEPPRGFIFRGVGRGRY
ncbi:UDP-N-acetyl-D-mannosamine dehydrogenase [Thermococcus thioreducens]|uniref:UDP-N-acetyl-D-mannosamine dehydrogenase n=1 Tax=Thermococcus thioreducens TaxID=277988 RepID=A0A1I0N0D9_9EURY|nr:UDP-N-acetyl-D-mannosamine dehydrogenase [Thermococcus thioreducens]ASJ12269.1 NDP-sugar dehydrogenase [Thermococcus thioreducens]SEV93809.1 UDP-N-acetyl-D-mannosaminuronic acid dehydrogenase [Thermococcus thioreducens]